MLSSQDHFCSQNLGQLFLGLFFTSLLVFSQQYIRCNKETHNEYTR